MISPRKIIQQGTADVQASSPDVRINLTRVGVKNVKKLVEVHRHGKRPVIFISNFDVYVDLPGSLKGANLSRNFEVIDEVLQQAIDGDVNTRLKNSAALWHENCSTAMNTRTGQKYSCAVSTW